MSNKMAATNESPEIRLAPVGTIKSESSVSHHHNHEHNHQQKPHNNHHPQTTGSSSLATLAPSKTKSSSDIPNFNNTQQNLISAATPSSGDAGAVLPPIVYGELSILGYNGYIPNIERNGRRNRSKFLLCKRTEPNGIKKSRHYIVKQPQATKAIQDKDLHSISYTFSRSQTIIVEYRQDENTDMFQIGRSSEDPIDFVVMDTISNAVDPHSTSSGAGSSHHHHHHHSSSSRHVNENNTNIQYQLHQQQAVGGDVVGMMNRFHRNMAKMNEEALHYGAPPPAHEPRNRFQYHHNPSQAVLLNYPQPNLSNLPPMMAEHFRNQDSSFYQPQQQHHGRGHHHGHSSGSHHQQPQQVQLQSPPQIQTSRSSHNNPSTMSHSNDQPSDQCPSNRHGCSNNNSSNSGNNLMYKRSQSTISRFACRILVDRVPPYTARIYAAGFDSSKNIFLGEKATKWEQDNSIDGLTTNGVLLMHPKRGNFYGTNLVDKQQHHNDPVTSQKILEQEHCLDSSMKKGNSSSGRNSPRQNCSTINDDKNNTTSELNNASKNDNHNHSRNAEQMRQGSSLSENSNSDNNQAKIRKSTNHYLHLAELSPDSSSENDANNNTDQRQTESSADGGVWREVSVDGGIYAIRESRSAAQKGTRIESESNILQDGTLIDLCGATLLWRSVEGFKAAPTKLSLEEKIDLLNASRPQCPVGLNTLVISRKPIPSSSHHHRSGGHSKDHHHKDSERNSHQPYVYLKCGHVQGYHDWGATEKTNQRTCPICISVGMVAKLSMGLEPSFYVDSGPLSHAFNPCGHMASERTIRYWCSIKIPHGTHFFHAICPFCASPLASNEPASTRLIFQDELD